MKPQFDFNYRHSSGRTFSRAFLEPSFDFVANAPGQKLENHNDIIGN